MAAYAAAARDALSKFSRTAIVQVTSSQNSHANALACLASAITTEMRRTILIDALRHPSIQRMEAEAVAEINSSPSWMDDIISYLKDNVLPEEKKVAHKMKLRAARFWLSPDGGLYQKSFTGPYLRCIHPDLVSSFLTKIHEGVCGIHTGGAPSPTAQSPRGTGGRT